MAHLALIFSIHVPDANKNTLGQRTRLCCSTGSPSIFWQWWSRTSFNPDRIKRVHLKSPREVTLKMWHLGRVRRPIYNSTGLLRQLAGLWKSSPDGPVSQLLDGLGGLLQCPSTPSRRPWPLLVQQKIIQKGTGTKGAGKSVVDLYPMTRR